jgi:hypothetical protein
MPFIISTDNKSRLDNPFKGALQFREIVVGSGAVWPTGSGSDYVIPLGTPMAPLTSSASKRTYKPIRVGRIAGTATAAELDMTMDSCAGFATGDVVVVLQNGALPTLCTISTTGTISALSYTTKVISLTNALGIIVTANCVVEVKENGLGTNPHDAVYLAENVQTRDLVSGTNVEAPARGVRSGQVEVNRLATHCFDALFPRLFPLMDFIPTSAGN